jgi:hypothetical protein
VLTRRTAPTTDIEYAFSRLGCRSAQQFYGQGSHASVHRLPVLNPFNAVGLPVRGLLGVRLKAVCDVAHVVFLRLEYLNRCSMASACASVTWSFPWYSVTLEVLLRFFIRKLVDLFVARATQIDGTAFDTITRNIFFVFLIFMSRTRHEIMLGDLTHCTAA